MDWAVFAVAPDEMTALLWCDLVRQAGVPCALKPGDTASYMGVSPKPVRLVAPRALVEQARAALGDNIGAGDEPAGPDADRGDSKLE